MSVDRDLSVVVRTTGDTSGAKDVSKALDQVTDKTKESAKTQEQATEVEKTGNATRRESREILRSIGEVAPGVAEIVRTAFLGVAGAIALFSKLLSEALDQIKEMGERSTPEFERLTEAVHEQKNAMEDADLAAQAYDRSLKRIATSTEAVQSASAAYAARLKEHAGGQETLLDKTQSRNEAMLEAAEKSGLITHEAYIAKKLALDEAYAAKRIALENKVTEALLVEKYRERANTQIEADNLERQLASKKQAAKKAAGEEKFSGKVTSKDEADLEKTEEKIKELEKEKEELQGFHPFKSEALLILQNKQNDQEQADQREIAAQLRTKIAQDEKRSQDAKENKGEADEDLKALKERLTKDRERLHELDTELPRDKTRAQEEIRNRNQGAALDSETRGFKALGEEEAIKTSGQDVTKSGDKLSATVVGVFNTISTTQATTMEAVAGLHGNFQEHELAIKQLARAIDDARHRAETQNLNIIK